MLSDVDESGEFMKASEAAKIVADMHKVDNSGIVIARITHAASKREFCIEVEEELMTMATRESLKSLGYLVVVKRETCSERSRGSGSYYVSWN